jgi:hypothetical protein
LLQKQCPLGTEFLTACFKMGKHAESMQQGKPKVPQIKPKPAPPKERLQVAIGQAAPTVGSLLVLTILHFVYLAQEGRTPLVKQFILSSFMVSLWSFFQAALKYPPRCWLLLLLFLH